MLETRCVLLDACCSELTAPSPPVTDHGAISADTKTICSLGPSVFTAVSTGAPPRSDSREGCVNIVRSVDAPLMRSDGFERSDMRAEAPHSTGEEQSASRHAAAAAAMMTERQDVIRTNAGML
jgi:hypothetical protein